MCALLILIKAHLFVANALALGLYTVALYPGLRARRRCLSLSRIQSVSMRPSTMS